MICQVTKFFNNISVKSCFRHHQMIESNVEIEGGRIALFVHSSRGFSSLKQSNFPMSSSNLGSLDSLGVPGDSKLWCNNTHRTWYDDDVCCHHLHMSWQNMIGRCGFDHRLNCSNFTELVALETALQKQLAWDDEPWRSQCVPQLDFCVGAVVFKLDRVCVNIKGYP